MVSAESMGPLVRLGMTGLMVVLSILMAFLGPGDSTRPPQHKNADRGYQIQPPNGWSRAVIDQDGSQIAPARQPSSGFASIIVSTRVAKGEDPLPFLEDVRRRRASGPVKELRWGPVSRITLLRGAPAVIAEFSEIYGGSPVRGWMVVTVSGPRLIQAVGTLPVDARPKLQQAVRDSLRSLEPL